MPSQIRITEVTWSADPGHTIGVYVGQSFALIKDEMVFGRHSQNDISLSVLDKVRRHGRLLKEGNNFFIEDISDGRRPILVNGIPIAGKTLLSDGDVIAVCFVKFVYLKDYRIAHLPN